MSATSRTIGVTGAVAALLAVALGVAWGDSAPGGKMDSLSPAKRAVAERVQAFRQGKPSQADREAAAERLKLMKKLSAATTTKTARGVIAKAPPGPGDVPDYFGTTANWAFSPPLRKFVDSVPGLDAANENNLGQYIPVPKPDTITYPGSDYYEIELRDYLEQMHTDLPDTPLRGYRQVNYGTDGSGHNTIAPAPIHYLGPMIVARKGRAVRIKFTNSLPNGTAGNLPIPVDTTIMGAGMGPLGMDAMPMDYTQNRATIHHHGGRNPWISDGTPNQWITPQDEDTPYKQGVSVTNVPDMWFDPDTHDPVPAGTPDATTSPGPGSQTFYLTNEQSARLMFYHDHSLGITRLNVYAGEAAGYIIEDATEDKLIDDGTIPTDQIPLIIQDKSFVDATTITGTDPTWNWGSTPGTARTGDLWYPHVYVPAQNPYDISGMNATGRWHYGPWFWPPTKDIGHGPVANPYYDPDTAPWEPPLMPGTPNPSAPGEAFMDTPVVNGTAFPYVEVEPKAYRLRILNAADDRFFNLQMYVADEATVSSDGRHDTEVKMVPASIAATNFPETWPTDGRDGGVPDPETIGPDWIQFGNESGFLPAPTVIPNQPVTWNGDPTTFNYGNVQDHSLLIGTAERADVVVDFSEHRGKTLIVYNDAPAAFPARDARLDYYTNAPDLTDTGGHPGPQVGFGPNTRTILQIRVEDIAPEPSFDTTALVDAFKSTDTTEGVFEAGQDPVPVGQSSYDSAYNATFPTTWPEWGYARILDTTMTIRTVAGDTLTLPLEPKAIQDEMGEAFDDYGRMMPKLGLELPDTQAGRQTFVLQNFVDPTTENVKASMTPMSPVAGDGTQIWKITHNGVDTHTMHFHLFDVQLLNRVGWDNAIRVPDANELGWKETIRVSPLEDTIVALRPVIPSMPFKVGDSVRPMDPTMPLGSTEGFTNIDPHTGEPIVPPLTNQLANFGWEYMWHCHILSHEEMEMMRPIAVQVSPSAPTTLVANATPTSPTAPKITVNWTNHATDPAATNYYVERYTNASLTAGRKIFSIPVAATLEDTTAAWNTTYYYRVRAENAVSYSAWSNTDSAKIDVLPVNLTIAASSSSVRFGQALKLSGTLTFPGPPSTPIVTSGLRIQRKYPGGSWTTVASGISTTASGAWTYWLNPSFNAYYRATWSGTGPYADAVSVPAYILVNVAQALTINQSATTIVRGGTITFTGVVSPTRNDKRVYLQWKSGPNTWKDLTSGETNASSAYSIPRAFPNPGTFYLRVYSPADSTNGAGYSRYITVVVT